MQLEKGSTDILVCVLQDPQAGMPVLHDGSPFGEDESNSFRVPKVERDLRARLPLVSPEKPACSESPLHPIQQTASR